MDDKRFQELEAIRNRMMLGASPFYAVNPEYGVESGLDPHQTIGFVVDQTGYDEDWKLLKAASNGVTSGLRGLFGSMSAAIAQNVARHQAQDPNYTPYGGYAPKLAEGLKDIANSDVLTPFDVKGKTALSQLGLDLVQGGTQLASQVAVTTLTGGVGGAVYMGASIAGNQYLDLVDKGVSVDRAATASLMNAPVQALLEQFGIGKLMKKFPVNTVWGAKLRQIGEAALAEGITEALQEYPEALTNIYAEHADKSREELLQMFKDDFGNITKSAMYAGLIGAILGGGGSATNLAFNKAAERKIRQGVHETKLENLEERIATEQKSGANYKYVATTVNNNMPDDHVHVDGEVLYQVASEKGIEKTASILGIAPEKMKQAMEDGNTVEIKQGNFEAMCVADNTFYQMVKDDIAFEAGGDTTNSLISEAIKVDEIKLGEAEQAEFDNAMSDLRNQMAEALVPKTQANAWEVLLTSRAMAYNPENPAEWFKNHPLQITRNGIVSVGGYNQNLPVVNTVALQQQAALKEKYIANNTMSVAPNGEKSNLTEDQYLAVRTNHFKRMFGNWLYNPKQQIKITKVDLSEDIVPGKKPKERTRDYKKRAQQAVRKWLVDNIYVGDIVVDDDNSIISISKDGLRASVKGVNNEKYSALLGIENLFKNAVYFGFEKADSRHKDNNIDGQDIYISYASIGGIEYAVKIKLDVVSYDKHLRYKTHQIYKLNDIEVVEIENKKESKSTSTGLTEDNTLIEPTDSNSLSVYNVSDLVKAVNNTDDEAQKIKVPTDKEGNPKHSLLLDENGEPKVLYRGIQEKYDENKQGNVVWVTPSEEQADSYRGTGRGSEILPVFAKASNIAYLGNSFTQMTESNFIDQVLQERIADAFRDGVITKKRALEILDELKAIKAKDDKQFYARYQIYNKNPLYFNILQELGYDAVSTDENGVLTYGIFGQENVKSATANNGNFDTWDKNIYRQQAKGQINFNSGQAIINLFEGADASTVIHETGHYFVEALAQDVALGRANAQMIADWKALLEYCGVTQAEWDKGGETRRKAHERLAEGFETYLMEGKAPSHKLRKAFSRFAKWLKAVYRKIVRNENAVPLTDEVREVFDRMLASEELIAEQARTNAIFSILPKAVIDNLSDKSLGVLQDLVEKAKEKAEGTLVAEALKNFTAERKQAIKEYRESWKPKVVETISQQPLYAATADLEEYLGVKQKAKTIARKYLNGDGKIYSDWQEELRVVNAEINDRLMPIVRRLESGAKKGVSIVKYGDDMSGRGVRVSNNDPWYQEWFKTHHRAPSNKEYMELAYGVYTGKDDVLGDWSTAGTNLSEAEYAEKEAMQERLTAEIDELISRRDELFEMKEAVAPFKHLGLKEEQRQTFDAIAETYGFASGADLAERVLEAPTADQAVEAMLKDLVDQKFPDIFQERSEAGKAAREALYNSQTAELIGLEMELINEAMNIAEAKEKVQALKAVKVETTVDEVLGEKKRTKEEKAKFAVAYKMQADVAADMEFARMSLRQAIKVDKYIAAERRCAAKAAEAAAKKDYARAMGYKKQQMFNHACVRKSMAVRKRFLQFQKYVKKQSKVNRDTWYREEYFNQACLILSRMGIKRKDFDPMLVTQNLPEFVAQMQEYHDSVDIADWIVNGEVDISNAYELTLSQYEDVINALKNIKALARADKAENAFNTKMSFEENKAQMLETLAKLETKFDPNGDNKVSFVDNYVASNMTASNMFEMIDGNKIGYFSEVIYKQGNICENKRADMAMKFEQAIEEATKEWLPTRSDKKKAAERIAYAELAGATLNKHELITMLIYLTTESSSRKLCSMGDNSTYKFRFAGSELWVDGDAEQTRQNILNFLGSVLTEADFKFAQKQVDACNMFWGELSDLEYRTKGFRPKKELAYPALISLPNGKEIKFTGGYIPLVRDGRAGSAPKNADVLMGTDTNENTGGKNIMGLHTNTGSSKARDTSVYPLELRRGYAFGAVRDTITDIALREYMSNIRKIRRDGELWAKIVEKLGEANAKVLLEHFDVMARPFGSGGYNNFADKVTGNYMGTLRKTVVHFAIMGKVSTALQNFGNILLYGGNIEGFTHMDALSALGNYFKVMDNGSKGYKAVLDTVIAESAFMRERMQVPDVSLRGLNTGETANIVEEYATKFGIQMLVHTDNLTALAVYMQARNKAIQEGKTKEDAILYAEEIIRRTIGSSRRADVASTFRAENIKLFTIFTSFFNTQYNQWLREYRIDQALFAEGKYKEAMFNVTTFVAAKYIMANALSLLLTGIMPWDDDDEDGYSNLTKSLVTYPFQLGGWQTQFGAVVAQELMGMDNYGYRMTPVQSLFDTVIRTAKKANRVVTGKAEVEELVEPATNVLAMRYGLPQQITAWFWNAYDIFVNDMDLQGSDVLRRRPARER